MIWFGTTKRLVFCPSSRFITNQIRIGSAYSCRAHRFVCVDHNFVFGCFFYSVLIVVIGPLAVMIRAQRKDIANVSAFYSIITIVFHELVRFVHMTLIITNRSRSFVMHDHFYSFGLRIVTNSFDIKIWIRSYEIKNIIFGMAKPIFPSFVPSFYQNPVKSVLRSKINVFFHIFGSSSVTTVGFYFSEIGNTKLHRRQFIGIRPTTFIGNHFPPNPNIFHRFYPRSIFNFTRIV